MWCTETAPILRLRFISITHAHQIASFILAEVKVAYFQRLELGRCFLFSLNCFALVTDASLAYLFLVAHMRIYNARSILHSIFVYLDFSIATTIIKSLMR